MTRIRIDKAMIDTHSDSHSFWPKHISNDQAKDTGMAFVLISLLAFYFTKQPFWFGFAVVLLTIDMIRPGVFRPAAKVWLGFSTLLGTVVSKLILTVLFFGMVTPIALIRKMMGADSLQLRAWKKGRESVFVTRDYKATAKDIEKPF